MGLGSGVGPSSGLGLSGRWLTRRIVGVVVALGFANPGFAASPLQSRWQPGEAVAQATGTTLGAGAETPPLFWGLIAAFVAAVLALWIMGVLKPGGLEKHVRNVDGSPTLIWMMNAIVLLAAQIVGAGLAISLIPKGDEARTQALASLGGSGVAIATGVVLVRLALLTSPRAGLRPRWGDLRRGLLAFVMVVPFTLIATQLSQIVYARIVGSPPDPAGHALLVQFRNDPENPWVWTLLGAAILLGPIFEELVYRAFLQSGFLRLTGRRWAAVALTTIVFVAMHHLPGAGGPAVPWHGLAPLVALSLGMGIAYERTGRLGVPIVMHVLFNAVNVGLMVWMMRGAQASSE